MSLFQSLQAAREAATEDVTRLWLDGVRGGWTELPEEVYAFTHLEELALNGHYRLTLRSDIARLSNLRVLSLTGGEYVLPDELGGLATLRELKLTGCDLANFPEALTALRLERLHIEAENWLDYLGVVTRIPVSINVTLLDGPDYAAEDLERADLSAWSELQELEIDAYPGFRPTVFERKLRKCGFCINEKSDPRAHL